MYQFFGILLLVSLIHGHEDNSITETIPPIVMTTTTEIPVTTIKSEPSLIPCSCGVFLSGQLKKGNKISPSGNPALLHEMSETYPCTSAGNKMCINKCLDMIVKHLPNSPNILCGSIERDIHKERAYLFIKNCKDEWVNTNLSAGREYCCKDGLPYKCPLLS
ncbi:follicle cell protein 3C-1 [Phymastichus coffea]|uniref:follicle cell protein 3C-1 n=1 Tax=Phymastichus coffea TaxID=108790 RepID=UPI00273B0EAE|nr:follicle cell protein 3C-1 [Phymastichus coffea]